MRPEVVDPCGHCGHAQAEHYFPGEVVLLVKPGICLHRDSRNGPRCPCSRYVAQPPLDTSDSRA